MRDILFRERANWGIDVHQSPAVQAMMCAVHETIELTRRCEYVE
jgi:hypothetical protein